MVKEKLIIIGGVEAGLGAATQARRNDPELEIIVFEKSEYISYGLCAMPYYIKGILNSPQDFTIYSPSYFKSNRNIDVKIKHLVQTINPQKKIVEVVNLEKPGEVLKINYDKLIIATGAKARTLNIEGKDLKNIFTFRHITQAIALKNLIKTEKPEKAVIVGSGLIGLTLVDALVENSIKVTLIEKEDRILPFFSAEISGIVEKELKSKGVEIITGKSVDAFIGKEKVEKVSCGGKLIPVDFVVLSIGVIPEVSLARGCGIKINKFGAIQVNNRQQTSIPHIYAAGDCTHSFDYITGKEKYIPLAGITDRQAQIAADNAIGIPRIYKGTVAPIVEKVFNFEIGRVGLTEREMIEENIDFISAIVKNRTKPHYMPGSDVITMKIYAEISTKRILGAEMVGREGVAKRIDVIGSAIYHRAKIEDLYDMEYSYAPPLAPSRDIFWLASIKLMQILKNKK